MATRGGLGPGKTTTVAPGKTTTVPGQTTTTARAPGTTTTTVAGGRTTSTTPGTTPSSTTPTPPCLPLDANDVGLTLCEGTGSDGTSVINVVGDCPCTSGTRQFVDSLTSDSPNDSEMMMNYYGVRCADISTLCICSESGVCCTPGPTPPDRIEFMPYCDAAGECHMYAVMACDTGCTRDTASLTCSDGSMIFMSDQFINPVDNTMNPLGPTSSYLQAQSVCCDNGGCGPIEPANEVCTGPTRPL